MEGPESWGCPLPLCHKPLVQQPSSEGEGMSEACLEGFEHWNGHQGFWFLGPVMARSQTSSSEAPDPS